jgi:hypothetical protein
VIHDERQIIAALAFLAIAFCLLVLAMGNPVFR